MGHLCCLSLQKSEDWPHHPAKSCMQLSLSPLVTPTSLGLAVVKASPSHSGFPTLPTSS